MTLLLKEFPFLRVCLLNYYKTITTKNFIIGIEYNGSADLWKHFIVCMENGNYAQDSFWI